LPPSMQQARVPDNAGDGRLVVGRDRAGDQAAGGAPLRSQKRVAGKAASPSPGMSRARTTNVEAPAATGGSATSTSTLLPGRTSVATGSRSAIGSVAGPQAGIAVTRRTVPPGSAARPALLRRTVALPGRFGSTDAR